jgi:uncharacterized protein (UPF0332 family)
MPVSQNLINKSEENWVSYQMLAGISKNNAAANRLYYSIFHLVYAEMVCNATKDGFSDDDKMGFDSKAKHDSSKRYVKRYMGIGKHYEKLYALRVRADYAYTGPPITKEELNECYKFWASIRNELVKSLLSKVERIRA